MKLLFSSWKIAFSLQVQRGHQVSGNFLNLKVKSKLILKLNKSSGKHWGSKTDHGKRSDYSEFLKKLWPKFWVTYYILSTLLSTLGILIQILRNSCTNYKADTPINLM